MGVQAHYGLGVRLARALFRCHTPRPHHEHRTRGFLRGVYSNSQPLAYGHVSYSRVHNHLAAMDRRTVTSLLWKRRCPVPSRAQEPVQAPPLGRCTLFRAKHPRSQVNTTKMAKGTQDSPLQPWLGRSSTCLDPRTGTRHQAEVLCPGRACQMEVACTAHNSCLRKLATDQQVVQIFTMDYDRVNQPLARSRQSRICQHRFRNSMRNRRVAATAARVVHQTSLTSRRGEARHKCSVSGNLHGRSTRRSITKVTVVQ